MTNTQVKEEELAAAVEAAFSKLDDHTKKLYEKFKAEQAAWRERTAREFVITKQHRRFTEFCDAVRRDRYIGLCYGPPGVGKTLSARRYTHWDIVRPYLDDWQFLQSTEAPAPAEIFEHKAILYTPKIHNTPRIVDKDLCFRQRRLNSTIERHLIDDQDLLV